RGAQRLPEHPGAVLGEGRRPEPEASRARRAVHGPVGRLRHHHQPGAGHHRSHDRLIRDAGQAPPRRNDCGPSPLTKAVTQRAIPVRSSTVALLRLRTLPCRSRYKRKAVINNSYLLADVARGHREELIATADNFRRRKPHPQTPRLLRLVPRAEVVPSLLWPGHTRTMRESAPAKS